MAERIRVFHLIKSLGRGGAERLLLAAVERPSSVQYAFGYFLPWKNALVEALRGEGAEVVCFGARSGVGMLCRVPYVVRKLRRWRADVVHCHLPLAGVIGRLAGTLAGIPVVYTEHNLMERYHPWTRRANLATWRLQHRVVAVSSEVADSIRRFAPADVPVEVVENGVDVEIFRPHPAAGLEARRRLGIPPEAPVVGQVAVFRPQKRLDLWLECVAEVRRRRPDTRFVLVGDGPERDRLERRARSLGLEGSVSFAGLQEDVRPFYSAFDVYLVSSDYEGLPVALLEAMASGAAVVSTAVGGVPEVVRSGRDGLLVPPGDLEGLAETVLRLLDSEVERARLGASARERVAESFSLDRMVRRLEAIYAELAAQGGRRG